MLKSLFSCAGKSQTTDNDEENLINDNHNDDFDNDTVITPESGPPSIGSEENLRENDGLPEAAAGPSGANQNDISEINEKLASIQNQLSTVVHEKIDKFINAASTSAASATTAVPPPTATLSTSNSQNKKKKNDKKTQKAAVPNLNANVSFLNKLKQRLPKKTKLESTVPISVSGTARQPEQQNSTSTSNINSQTSTVPCILLNVDSLKSKKTPKEFSEYVSSLMTLKKISRPILFCVETHLTKQDQNKTVCPHVGYKVVRSDRTFKNGGGLAVFLPQNFTIDVVNGFTKSSTDFEAFVVKITKNLSNGILNQHFCIVYRSYIQSTADLSKLIKYLGKVRKDYQNVIILGDFNLASLTMRWLDDDHIDRNVHQDSKAKYLPNYWFMEFITINKLRQHVQQSTHSRNNILDLLITRRVDAPVMNVQVKRGFVTSDHNAVHFDVVAWMNMSQQL